MTETDKNTKPDKTKQNKGSPKKNKGSGGTVIASLCLLAVIIICMLSVVVKQGIITNNSTIGRFVSKSNSIVNPVKNIVVSQSISMRDRIGFIVADCTVEKATTGNYYIIKGIGIEGKMDKNKMQLSVFNTPSSIKSAENIVYKYTGVHKSISGKDKVINITVDHK